MVAQNLSANRASINEAQINTLTVGSINYMNSVENNDNNININNNSEIINELEGEIVSVIDDNRHIIVKNNKSELFYLRVKSDNYRDLLNSKFNFTAIPRYELLNCIKNKNGRYKILVTCVKFMR
mgnify:CR=1 FL=1